MLGESHMIQWCACLRLLPTLAHLVRRDDNFQFSLDLPTLAELGSGHRAIPLQRLERILQLIPTTATAAEKLKRLAKTQRKGTGSSLAVALDAVAIEHGYTNWKHVTWCAEQGKIAGATVPFLRQLPGRLAQFLNDVIGHESPTSETKRAFQNGLVFAVDVKHAGDVVLGDDVVACDDGASVAAVDVWTVLVNAKDEETGAPLLQDLDDEALLEVAREHLMDYRFFRYTGASVPASLDDAFAKVLGRTFFPPTHVWLKGKFIDMSDVPEVRVDGRVVYASAPGEAFGSSSSAQQRDIPALLASQPVTSASRQDGIIPRLDISKIDSGLYGYTLSYRGQEMDSDAGFSSIREAIESAAEIEGNIRGVEVSYAGLMVGTYPLTKLLSSAEQVAQRALETASLLRDY
jgi:hypothetical protein